MFKSWFYPRSYDVFDSGHEKEKSNENTGIVPYIIRDVFAPESFYPEEYINRQLLLSVVASLAYLYIGLVRGYSSTAVLSMKRSGSPIIQTPDAESWISAMPPLGAMLGSICAGPIMERWGRKHTLLASAAPSAASWCLIALAGSFEVMLAARFLTGFCVGIVLPSAQVYVSECSDPKVRGILGSLPALFMAGGILLSYLLGAWLAWQPLAWASAILPAILFGALIPLPESPPWLLSHGRPAEAAQAVRWLHHNKTAVQHTEMELRATPPDLAQVKPAADAVKDERDGTTGCRLMFRGAVLFPFFLSLALLAFQQLSGIDAVVFYTVAIFESSGSPLNDHVATILVGLVQLVSNFLALFVVDRAGRKPLLIASGLIMAISMSSLGTYFYLLERQRADHLHLLPLVSLLSFMVGFSIGFCSLPFLLMGELLPMKQRSFLSSIAGSFNLGVMFVVIKTYPNLKEVVGSAVTFWIYAGFSLTSCIFVAFLVPETKGRTLDEIENYFEKRHPLKFTKPNVTEL